MSEYFSRMIRASITGSHARLAIPVAILTIVFAINPADAREVIVQGEPVPPTEAARLDPVCKLIIVEQPMVHLEQRRKEFAQLFDKPEYRMAKNADWFHHRCWAMISKQRSFAAYSPKSRLKYSPKWYAKLFHDDMNYIFKVAPSNWKYMPQMLYEDGDMYLIERDYGNASKNAIRAIGLDPQYSRSYELLADTYSQMGNKKKALEATTEGLKHDPTSKRLIRRHVELGGTPPVVAAQPAAEESTAIESPLAPIEPTPIAEPVKTPAAVVEAPATGPQEVQAAPPTVAPPQSKTNPYCRFCP